MAILGWIWRRRFHVSESVRSNTPRRLVYCLPMRVLVEQARDEAERWIGNLVKKELLGKEDIQVHMVMRGEVDRDWTMYPERDAILIGTQDMLLSRALNRGYAVSRSRWPVEFGLLNNDCLWVFDEVQLMGSGVATGAQLAAFRNDFGVSGQSPSIWMSATLERNWLQTVDFSKYLKADSIFSLDDNDRQQLKPILDAPKTLRRGEIEPDKNRLKNLAQYIRDKHQPETQTIVILNTVMQAQELYGLLTAAYKKAKQSTNPPDFLLIHSRFRPEERGKLNAELKSNPNNPKGRIIIATQVVEAGVDISCQLLVTEAAPWSGLVQRFGRCNRYGEYENAEIIWIDVKDAVPYEEAEIGKARESLLSLEGQDVSPNSLKAAGIPIGDYRPRHVIRKKDLIELFDTTPDLAGNDIDISRYVRDEDDCREVQVFWREWENEPRNDMAQPDRNELCGAPIGDFRKFLNSLKNGAFVWDYLDRKWISLQNERVCPGLVVLLPKEAGGYDEKKGWTGNSSDNVFSPVPPPAMQVSTFDDDSDDADPASATGRWVTLADHTNRVVSSCEEIVNALRDLETIRRHKECLLTAARWHDAGKSYWVFQKALIEPPPEQEIWAKGKLDRYERRFFRHELVSTLAFLKSTDSETVEPHLRDLAAYLIASHHGKIRLAIRSMPGEKVHDDPKKRFARGVWEGEKVGMADLGGGVTSPKFIVDLELMELGLTHDGQPSWIERTLNLRDQKDLGPFRLAFLEAVFRVSDRRGSKEDRNHE